MILSTFSIRPLQSVPSAFRARWREYTTRSVQQLVYAKERPEGIGGSTVRRAIGVRALRNLTPFLLFDHGIAPKGSGFPDHPHRGQTTVTYVLDGFVEHEDFTGEYGKLARGDLQWMTAGRGIMHSEMPWYDPSDPNPPPLEVIQLWLDLPEKDKGIEPSYQDRRAGEIASARPEPGVEIKVISGESHGVFGCVRPVGGCWYFDVLLDEGKSVFQQLPCGWTGFAYVIDGALSVDGDEVPRHTLAVLTNGEDQDGVLLSAPEGSGRTRAVLLAGEPLEQPIVLAQHGLFVVTSEEAGDQALADWKGSKNGFERAKQWHSTIGAEIRKRIEDKRWEDRTGTKL